MAFTCGERLWQHPRAGVTCCLEIEYTRAPAAALGQPYPPTTLVSGWVALASCLDPAQQGVPIDSTDVAEGSFASGVHCSCGRRKWRMERGNDGNQGGAGGADPNAAMRDCCGTSLVSDHYRSSSYIYIYLQLLLLRSWSLESDHRCPAPKGTPPDIAGGAGCRVLRRGWVSRPWPGTPGRT